MGNLATCDAGATVLSKSTRNFLNRLGDGDKVYLCSAELAAIGALLGKIHDITTYMKYSSKLQTMSQDIYHYMNFHKMPSYQQAAENIVSTG